MNIPTLLVAPNGFGKSSIATGFSSLASNKLEMADDNLHNGSAASSPEIKISYTLDDNTSGTKVANSAVNEIFSRFGVYVINSHLVPKAKVFNISGRAIATPSIEVADIKLINQIPPKTSFSYSYSAAKAAIGINGKILPNISTLLSDHKLMRKIFEVDFSKENQVGFNSSISKFKLYVNSLGGGTARQIIANVENNQLDAIRSIPFVENVAVILRDSTATYSSDVEYYFAALQICDLHKNNRAEFRSVRKYYDYVYERESYIAEFAPFKATWKNISPTETNGSLVLKFPKANQISNGERDTLCLVAALLRAKRKMQDDCSILIIDEVFDYLDDANLIACQYHLTQMIAEWKQSGRRLFPIILTHLDPNYFRNFTFNNQQVAYLARDSRSPGKEVENLIRKRDDQLIKDRISKFFLHFHPDECDLSGEFSQLQLDMRISTASKFNQHVLDHLNRYLSNRNYDPISVCCAVRNLVEQKTYEKIDITQQIQFLSTHKTVEKLKFAQEQGVDIPDQYSLLAIIYNEAVHIRKGSDTLTPLFSKLDNLTVKHMIREITSP
jgi:hypothetical protein